MFDSVFLRELIIEMLAAVLFAVFCFSEVIYC